MSDRTAAIPSTTAGSSASAAATPVSIAVRHRIALGDRRVADVGRVADRAGARRRRVDHEPDAARRDQLQDRRLLAHGLRAELRDWTIALDPGPLAGAPACPPVAASR